MIQAIIIIFIAGYVVITLEHSLEINKAATALMSAVLCWTVYVFDNDADAVTYELLEHLGEVSGILFFLMGAMTIVELIDVHDGFELINRRISTRSRRKLLWVICSLTFFLSAILDNLTTTIVMVTLIVKLIKDRRSRLTFVGLIVIAANAGGAWSPIGDITTTMLWIGGQISATSIASKLIGPCLVCTILPLMAATFFLNGDLEVPEQGKKGDTIPAPGWEQRTVLITGIVMLMSVPVFKMVTELPPFMGMLLGLSVMWLATEIMHRKKDKEKKRRLSVAWALERMDMSSILFFLGILLAVGVLQNAGILNLTASWLSENFRNQSMMLSVMGILSAIVDNVPLVAACIGMYPIEDYPIDSSFWTLLAYCAGTGGSLLIIGSAAGVAAMGVEKIPFWHYLKQISWLAMLGYFGGIGTFLLQNLL